MSLDFQTQVLTQLGDIKAMIATATAHTAAQQIQIDDLKKTNNRQWWMHALNPLLTVILSAAHRFGV